MAKTAVDAPRLVITDSAGSTYIFDAYNEVQVQDYVDVSVMSNRGGGSLLFNHGKRPRIVSAAIECKGGLSVPRQGRGITQANTSGEQVEALRSLLGTLVTVDGPSIPAGGIHGLLTQANAKPDLENDDGSYVSIEVTEEQAGAAFSSFGEIELVPLPAEPSKDTMPGSGQPKCHIVMPKGLEKVGEASAVWGIIGDGQVGGNYVSESMVTGVPTDPKLRAEMDVANRVIKGTGDAFTFLFKSVVFGIRAVVFGNLGDPVGLDERMKAVAPPPGVADLPKRVCQ
jgi:hypothetical protein